MRNEVHGPELALQGSDVPSRLGSCRRPRSGAGAALMLPQWLHAYALPLLAGGALVHGLGLTRKCRLERRDGPPLWWERALFWLCWCGLAALGLWIAVVSAAR